MKLWVVMLLIMAAITAGGIYMEQSILRATDRISHHLDSVEKHIKGEQWAKARHLCSEIDKDWSAQKELWSPYIHNQELDEIAIQLARLLALLEVEEKSEALAEISVIKVQLVQLHHQEVLTIRNIF